MTISFKEYFTFSKSERNGTIVLLILILLVIVSIRIVNQTQKGSNPNFADFEKEIDSFHQGLVEKKTKKDYRKKTTPNQTFSADSLFCFDPNTATQNEWQKLGVPARLIKTITNYLKKGSRFRKAEDLKKIYGMKDEIFLRLKPYITVHANTKAVNTKKASGKKPELFDFDPNNTKEKDWKRLGFTRKQISMINNYLAKGGQFRKKEDLKKMYCISEEKYSELKPYVYIVSTKNTEKPTKPIPLIININSADKMELVKLKGIGEYYAESIIKYREKLGGFINTNQLLEIYNFRVETYESIEEFIKIDKTEVRQINVNTADVELFGNHPYIQWKYAKQIINHRNRNGKFHKIEDILLHYLIPEKDFNKAKRYLTI